MNPRLLLLLTALLLGTAACSPTRFVRTDAAFVATRSNRPPAVFISEAPGRPWRAVGRIEVTLSGKVSTDEVMAMAVEAGQQAGCELLAQGVQPRQSSAQRFTIRLAVLRNGHDHGDHAPPPQPRETPEARASSSTSSSSSASSGGSSSGGADGPVSGGGETGRTRRWKFECGVYEASAPTVNPI